MIAAGAEGLFNVNVPYWYAMHDMREDAQNSFCAAAIAEQLQQGMRSAKSVASRTYRIKGLQTGHNLLSTS